MKLNLFFLFCFYNIFCLKAQITFQPLSTNDLHQILGPDYIINEASISMQGMSGARSKYEIFNSTNESKGLVLTTGTTLGQYGPTGPNNSPNAGTDNGSPGNSILSSISGSQTFNASLISFKFIPLVDSIELNYFFGSEEYMEYCLTSFNDLSVILIKGPGIGSDINHDGFKSLNRLPNNKIVTVNTVHPNGVNSNGVSFQAAYPQYFINNAGGTVLQYDGFTTFLKAKANLIIGETYTMIFAIADVYDAIFDSGIFIKFCNSPSLDLEDKSSLLELKIFPNPANDVISIQLNEGVHNANVEIYSLSGELLIKQEIDATSSISVSSLEKGTYIVKLLMDNLMISTGKFVK